MKRVYVLTGAYDYSYRTVLAVYEDREEAEREMERLEREPDAEDDVVEVEQR